FSTNDRGSLTASQSLENIADWIAVQRGAGKVVIIGDETPRLDLTNETVPPLSEHIAVRDGIRAMHNPAQGVYVAPTWAALASSGDPDMANANLLYDNVHANPTGGFALGAAFASVISSLYPARDVLAGGANLVTNGTMAGTGGTVTAPATGVAATG